MHRNPVVEYRTGATPRLTVILVHGRTLDPAYMQALAERLAVPDTRFLFPAADGKSWYPKSFLAPLTDNEPNLSAALAAYDEIVSGLLAAGEDPARIVVGGFSQGACLTVEYLHRHPRRLGGAILWTGGLIGPDETDWQPRLILAGMPVYLTTGETDPFVPPARVLATADWLKQSGAVVTAEIFPARQHLVGDAEIAAARTILVNLPIGSRPLA